MVHRTSNGGAASGALSGAVPLHPLGKPGREWTHSTAHPSQDGCRTTDHEAEAEVWYVTVNVGVTVAVCALDSDDATGLAEERVRAVAPDLCRDGDIRIDSAEWVDVEPEWQALREMERRAAVEAAKRREARGGAA